MFESRTVFVIGAGASADLDLPLGSVLRDQIAQLLAKVKVEYHQLTGPDEIIRAMHARSNSTDDLNEYIRAARAIAANLPLVRSIDEFIDQHSGDKG